MGNGETLFVVKALVDYRADESHRAVAEALARYAVANRYHEKVKRSWWNGKPTPFSGNIGVALILQKPAGPFRLNHGWRYVFSVDELKERLANQSVERDARSARSSR
jgi:hypothetical protein